MYIPHNHDSCSNCKDYDRCIAILDEHCMILAESISYERLTEIRNERYNNITGA